MQNLIDRVFQANQGIKIMTHVVAGYPDLATSKEIILAMDRSEADLIEIQIPFSDPMADGRTIMTANQTALDNGTSPTNCFQLVRDLQGPVNTPLLFMTYGNIPFNMGMERFIRESARCGISGLIIPDLPFDEDNENYPEMAKNNGLHSIHVVSPDVPVSRLKEICKRSSGFIYTTLKVGITGARTAIDRQGLAYVDTIKKQTRLPVAAGFGISSPAQVKQLQGIADIAVIGSHVINLYDQHGLAKVIEFLGQCKGN